MQAIDIQSGIQVELKVYRKRKLSALSRYQVEREIRIHLAVDHDHIIKLYSAFEDERNVYLVQEFAGGGDLFEELRRNGGLVKEKYAVRDVLAPLLNSLCYLHNLDIIHRDIKPKNILLNSSKMIKLADFGLSIDCSAERPVTPSGTLNYMAPEVLICPDKRRPEENKDKTLLVYGPAIDVWAVDPAHRPSAYDLLKHPWIQQFARSKDSGALSQPMHRLIFVFQHSDSMPLPSILTPKTSIAGNMSNALISSSTRRVTLLKGGSMGGSQAPREALLPTMQNHLLLSIDIDSRGKELTALKHGSQTSSFPGSGVETRAASDVDGIGNVKATKLVGPSPSYSMLVSMPAHGVLSDSASLGELQLQRPKAKGQRAS